MYNRSRKIIEYCRRDTEITGKFVASMLNTYKNIGCECRTTIASTTLNYFEQRFYKKVIHKFTEEQIDFFHKGYYGGRTEIFFNKPITGKIYYHDINSLYPYCLKTGIFPKLELFYETKKPDFEQEGVAEIEIHAPKSLYIPYLPCKYADKLIFPIGIIKGIYTYFEIREALKLGYIIKNIYRCIEFPEQFNPFESFIGTLYKERMKAQAAKDELLSLVFKAFGNHAYGKYAQRNETTELIPISKLKTIPEGTVILGNDLALIKRKTKYPRHANCIWSMYTTAYARHRLYFQGLKPVHEAGALLLYCDTDSVLYKHRKQLIPHSKELGEFKLEGVFSYAHFKLPKLYKLISTKRNEKHIYKAKGVPTQAAKKFFQTGKAKFNKPNKLRETLRRNLSPNKIKKLIPNYWGSHEKEIRGKYEKRVVLTTGHTTPVCLN